jgi:REP element-mobilizing transposase RayT
MCGYVQRVLLKLLKEVPGVEIKMIGFDLGHMHMLLVILLKYSISEAMGRMKNQSMSVLRKSLDG